MVQLISNGDLRIRYAERLVTTIISAIGIPHDHARMPRSTNTAPLIRKEPRLFTDDGIDDVRIPILGGSFMNSPRWIGMPTMYLVLCYISVARGRLKMVSTTIIAILSTIIIKLLYQGS